MERKKGLSLDVKFAIIILVILSMTTGGILLKYILA
mgnify:CR=1 FL=1